ncbi:PLP-dependent aminotransferase family protein [Pelosinus fermentans]|uniref:Putative transcriptional regulator, GntR family n=1 Tax=Pelosinus fermentans JBW45 TaxID=1192197 RepID=I9NLQ7_9FIRM|nr:PLP-dependent aminotransferase family protein [Pelosinus fermentans]AJQ29550.1 putative transcriptional regulator, GntR family [Pelosinus fermentans JBW45]
MAVTFAKRMKTLRASEIREILKITQREEVLSFAGGLPAPELFPVEELKEISIRVLEQMGREALQYSTTEGYKPLREKIAERMNRKFKTSVTADNIVITCGSQQALDLSGKLFLDEGDIVLCESPTYLAAISALKAYGPRFIEVPTDDQGMIIEELEKIIAAQKSIKLIYVIPDFQNPTGKTWSLERRRDFMKLVQQYDIPVIEDNPYGELRFENEILPSLKSMDRSGKVIFTSTFSKTFCPGLRIGWIAADAEFIEKYVLVKQGADLCTSIRSQMEIAAYMDVFDFETHIEKLVAVYRKRRDVMVEMLNKTMPQGVSFTHPQGGLFLWVELPRHIKSVDLLHDCLKNNVAFVPGDSFFPNGGVENTFRLNYSNMSEEKIIEGIQRLALAIKNVMI